MFYVLYYPSREERSSRSHSIAPETVPRATIAHSILSSMNDFTLALLPIAMLWNINLDKKTKVTISTLLGLGVL